MDDSAELLGGSQKRQRLFPYRPISRRVCEELADLVVDSFARREFSATDAARHRQPIVTAVRPPKWITINSAVKWMFMFHPPVKTSAKCMKGVQKIVDELKEPSNVRIIVRGSAHAMQVSFRSFGLGLILATVLVYLILVAQFKSFLDPLLILLAVPTGLTGVLLILFATGTTLNVMSLMGIVMMVGIVVSNSILIVEFTNRLRAEGRPLREAVSLACRVRLRPVLMTSLATLMGLIPMALKLGTGSEAYAPLARAIIGGLAVSVVLTVFIVPAAYFILYRRKEPGANISMDLSAASSPTP